MPMPGVEGSFSGRRSESRRNSYQFRWTNERLRAAIERRFGVRYSRGHAWKIATDFELSHLIRKARR